MKRAFTLLEVICVAVIISALLMLAMPVYVKARIRAGTAVCASNLRQIAIAIQMYRSANDGLEVYGTPKEMGTAEPWTMIKYSKGSLDLMKCRGYKDARHGVSVYTFLLPNPGEDSDAWASYAKDMKDAAVFAVDPNHGDKPVDFGEYLTTYKVMGMAFSGQLVTKSIDGNYTSYDAWR